MNSSSSHESLPEPSREITKKENTGTTAQRLLLASALTFMPAIANAQNTPIPTSPRVRWSISAGLVGTSTNLTDVTTAIIPAREEGSPTDLPGPRGLGGYSRFPAYPLQARPFHLWSVGVPGMIHGSVDWLWKEKYSIGATLGMNLLRLPIPGLDLSTNIVTASAHAAYQAPNSILDIHANAGLSISWNTNHSTPIELSLNASIGTSLYTSRTTTGPRGFFSFNLGTNYIPNKSEVWLGAGISTGVQFQ